MNQFGVIMALLFSLIIAVFAIANNQPVVINYLYGRAEVSAVVVILGAAILGAMTIFLLSLWRQVKISFQLRAMRNEIDVFKKNIRELERERDLLTRQIGQLEQAYAQSNDEIKMKEQNGEVSFPEDESLVQGKQENRIKKADESPAEEEKDIE